MITFNKRRRALFAAGALAVTGAVVTGAFAASGAGLGSENVLVPISPCRLLDTRPGIDNVGTRTTPLPTKTLVEFSVHGTNGNCTIPTSASAVAANVTIVNPTTRSFLTLFNSDAASRPTASNLNWGAGQLPTPNQATIPLSPAGKFTAYNHNGTVDMIIDIVGYYQTSTNVGATGPQGPIGPQGPTGPQGPAGPAGQRTMLVQSGGTDLTNGQALIDAFDAVTPLASVSDPWLIKVEPGIYDLGTATITLFNGMHLQGAGADATTITSDSGALGTIAVNSERSTIADITATSSNSLPALDVVGDATVRDSVLAGQFRAATVWGPFSPSVARFEGTTFNVPSEVDIDTLGVTFGNTAIVRDSVFNGTESTDGVIRAGGSIEIYNSYIEDGSSAVQLVGTGTATCQFTSGPTALTSGCP